LADDGIPLNDHTIPFSRIDPPPDAIIFPPNTAVLVETADAIFVVTVGKAICVVKF
jgi:hypothetical protein